MRNKLARLEPEIAKIISRLAPVEIVKGRSDRSAHWGRGEFRLENFSKPCRLTVCLSVDTGPPVADQLSVNPPKPLARPPLLV